MAVGGIFGWYSYRLNNFDGATSTTSYISNNSIQKSTGDVRGLIYEDAEETEGNENIIGPIIWEQINEIISYTGKATKQSYRASVGGFAGLMKNSSPEYTVQRSIAMGASTELSFGKTYCESRWGGTGALYDSGYCSYARINNAFETRRSSKVTWYGLQYFNTQNFVYDIGNKDFYSDSTLNAYNADVQWDYNHAALTGHGRYSGDMKKTAVSTSSFDYNNIFANNSDDNYLSPHITALYKFGFYNRVTNPGAWGWEWKKQITFDGDSLSTFNGYDEDSDLNLGNMLIGGNLSGLGGSQQNTQNPVKVFAGFKKGNTTYNRSYWLVSGTNLGVTMGLYPTQHWAGTTIGAVINPQGSSVHHAEIFDDLTDISHIIIPVHTFDPIDVGNHITPHNPIVRP